MVVNRDGFISVFDADSGEEIIDIPRYLLSVQVHLCIYICIVLI